MTCLIPTKTAKYKTKLNKKTTELLLKKLFVLDDQEQNQKKIINEYAHEKKHNSDLIYLFQSQQLSTY